MGKKVIISALKGNFKRELFKPIAKIIPKCEEIEQFRAYCGICKEGHADFTLRTIKNEEEICIGGSDMYKPVCRICYNNPLVSDPIKNEINGIQEKAKIYKV